MPDDDTAPTDEQPDDDIDPLFLFGDLLQSLYAMNEESPNE